MTEQECVDETSRKIAIMAAYCDGHRIEACRDEVSWHLALVPLWDWAHVQYRVAKAPAVESGEDR